MRASTSSPSTRDEVAGEAAAGDVRDGLHLDLVDQRPHRRRVDHRRRRAVRRPASDRAPSHAGIVERAAGDVEVEAARQRVAVRSQIRRRQTDHHIARRDVRPVMMRDRSTTPTANPTRSNSPGSISAGCSAISPPISAQPACRHLRRRPRRSASISSGVELPDRDVVEEEQRLRALARRCRRRTSRRGRCRSCRSAPAPGDERLRADAVGRRHEHRVLDSRVARRRTARRTRRCRRCTSGRNVERTCSLISSTASSPAAMSTPAAS